MSVQEPSSNDQFKYLSNPMMSRPELAFFEKVIDLCYKPTNNREEIDERLRNIREHFAQATDEAHKKIPYTKSQFDDLAKPLAEKLCVKEQPDDLDSRISMIVHSALFDLMVKDVQPTEFRNIHKTVKFPEKLEVCKKGVVKDNQLNPTLEDWLLRAWDSTVPAGKMKRVPDDVYIQFLKAFRDMSLSSSSKIESHVEIDVNNPDAEGSAEELMSNINLKDKSFYVGFGDQEMSIYQLKCALQSKEPNALADQAPVVAERFSQFDEKYYEDLKLLLIDFLDEQRDGLETTMNRCTIL